MATDTRLMAFYDTRGFGLIPCRIRRYIPDGITEVVEIELTATRGKYATYKAGDIVITGKNHVVSRKTRQTKYATYVRTIDHDAAKAALTR